MKIVAMCKKCHDDLDIEASAPVLGNIEIVVRACEECATEKEEESYEDGKAAGYEDGYDEGCAAKIADADLKASNAYTNGLEDGKALGRKEIQDWMDAHIDVDLLEAHKNEAETFKGLNK